MMTNKQNDEVISDGRFDVYKVTKKQNRVIVFDLNRCKGCKICVSICPYDSLFMSKDKSTKGFFYPMENTTCKACRKCLYACPDFAISIHKLEDIQ